MAHNLFIRAQIQPTRVAKKYQVDGEKGEWECDLVLEDSSHIVFVECKAKPLTRTAMAGISGEALLDFTGGVLLSQAQALRHERFLKTSGYIEFVDGYRLSLDGRKILRLSITLMDLGALQDRGTFVHLYEILARSEVSAEPGYGKTKQLLELNKELNGFREEILKLTALGEDARAQAFSALSLGVGQLAILLEGVDNLDALVKRMPRHVMTGSGNALVDFYTYQKWGMFTPPLESGKSGA